MTLEEAIIHAKEVADYQEHDAELWDRSAEFWDNDVPYAIDKAKECRRCAVEHRQLAEWLKELKAFRQAKTKILESIEELRENAKYHAYPIQDNTEMVIFGAEMALNIIDNKHN